MKPRVDNTVVFLGGAGAVVGVLAAWGKFNAVLNFPVIFALVCLVIGLRSLWRERSRRPVALRGIVLLAGITLAVGGWIYQKQVIVERQADRRLQILEVMDGSVVPSLAGLEPLNTDQAAWDAAASLVAPATVVTFWARWCSPCWKEMEELEELHQQYGESGLQIVALTRYDHPEDEEERRSDFDKARKFLAGRDITYPTAITDRDDLYRSYRTSSPPSTFLVDAQGRVVDYGIDLESVRALMERAVAMVTASS